MRQQAPRSGFKFWQIALGLVACAGLAAVFWPVRGRGGSPSPGSSCQSNLKQVMLGVKQYIQDYDEKYPPLKGSKAEFGWAGTLQPYLKSKQILRCPNEKMPPQTLASQPGYTDYWLNGRMAGLSEAKLDHQELTISLGDGDSNNARYHLFVVPRRWLGHPKSPLFRHVEGANFAFADGHAKWFKADQWDNGLQLARRYTLRIESVD